MQEPDNRNGGNELIEAAKSEISAMGKQGMDHPSTKPVLIGAAIGAAVGYFLLGGSWFLGLFVGAAIALYQRIKK
ncbi:MAG TPA: hypothetical protein VLA37_04590 [Sphingomonadaceae bacterium]|nr:hypothetical protein [Sphingomonadaceae bacterium]